MRNSFLEGYRPPRSSSAVPVRHIPELARAPRQPVALYHAALDSEVNRSPMEDAKEAR